MDLLVVGDIGIIFTYEYITEIASKFPNCSVDVLSFAPRKEANAEREKYLKALGCNIFYQPQYKLLQKYKLLHIFIRLREFFRYRVCKKYDVVNIHFPGVDSLAACFWAKKKARLVTSIYGSDVLRASKRGLKIVEKLLMRSDAVNVASSFVKAQISQKFNANFVEKTEIVRYGSNAAAYMCKEIAGTTKAESKRYFGFPEDRITVLCGYNGSKAQKHIEILEQFRNLPAAVQNRMFLVFQCSYGFSEEYGRELSARLAESPLDGVIVTEFMKGEALAKFRNSIDIFLNLQPTDVLSATMIEELEADAVVIKGDWLSYPDLEGLGVYLRSISAFSALPADLEYIVTHIAEEQEKTVRNKGIWEILSWEKQYENWEKIIFG